MAADLLSGSEEPYGRSQPPSVSLPRLSGGGSSQPRDPSPHESPPQSPGRGPPPMVRRLGVAEDRPWRRSATLPHHRPERRNDPPRPPRIGRLALGLPPRPHPATRGGAQALEKKVPSLMNDLLAVVEEHTGGDPMGPRKWVRRSLRNLSKDLKRRGHDVCATTVGKLLRERDYSPKGVRSRQCQEFQRNSGDPALDRVLSSPAKGREPLKMRRLSRDLAVSDPPAFSQERSPPWPMLRGTLPCWQRPSPPP